MKDAEIIEQTIAFAKETLSDAEGGHDWFHIQRVFKNTLLIAKDEEVDILVVSLAAILHDIADSKFHQGDEEIGPRLAGEFLRSLKVETDIIDHVLYIIRNMSFRNSLDLEKKPEQSLEFQVVQDADRLDAIGAIGIARTFNYGGYKGALLYDPQVPPKLKMDKDTYKKGNGPTINHFYEKLLLLKEQMNTASARKIAGQRHQFMLDYLEQFYNEWNGRL